ncbi:hypothetical protein EV426DRAFT_703757 [Tirmania nivea]|nr:hypothetical protein EV426DRAFT_703757 [Tirmania nivea]
MPRILFWAMLCISLRPVASNRALDVKRGYTSNKATTNKAKSEKHSILAILQAGIHIFILLGHILGHMFKLLLLCFGIDTTLVSFFPTHQKDATTNTDKSFLGCLNAALTIRNILGKIYALITTIYTHAVNTVQLGDNLHQSRNYSDTNFPIPEATSMGVRSGFTGAGIVDEIYG